MPAGVGVHYSRRPARSRSGSRPFNRRFPISNRSRKMDELKLIIQPHERFRGPEKQVTSEIEVAEKMVDHLRFRGAVEIDQNVAAEDQVHALHEKHS